MSDKSQIGGGEKIKNQSDVEYLLTQLLAGFTVTDNGLEWLHDKSLSQLTNEDFERSMSPYLSTQQAADLEVMYRCKRYG